MVAAGQRASDVSYLRNYSVMGHETIKSMNSPSSSSNREKTFVLPADREAVADRILTDSAAEAVDREHLVRVVVLQDMPDRPDGLLVLVQPAGGVDVV